MTIIKRKKKKRSWVDYSLNHKLKSWAKKKFCFTGPRSPLEALENGLAVVCVASEVARAVVLKGQTDILLPPLYF